MTGTRIDFPVPHPSPFFDAEKEEQSHTPDPLPHIPFTSMSKDGWQEYLQEKLHEHRTGANPDALLGIKKAVHALNEYERTPSTGELLQAEGTGLAKFPGQAMRGIGQLLEDIGGGHGWKAGQDILGGISQGVKGLAMLPGAALKTMGGGDVPEHADLSQRAEDYGSSTGMVGTAAIPSMIKSMRGNPAAPAEVAPRAVAGTPRPTPPAPGNPNGTLSAADADPYGLSDPRVASKANNDWVLSDKPGAKKPMDDLLSPGSLNSKTTPLTQAQLDQIVADLNKKGPYEPDASQRKLGDQVHVPKSEGAHMRPPTRADRPNPGIRSDMRESLGNGGIEPMDAGPTTADVLGLLSGKMGRFARVLSALPDATAVSRNALTKALKASTFSGMNPDSTNVK